MEAAPAFSPNPAKSTLPNTSPVERNVRVRSITDPAFRAGASRPRRRNATIALDHSDNPAPTSAICGVFSKTAASIPTRYSAIAAASPPMPPPMINARMVAYRIHADTTTSPPLMLTALGAPTERGRNSRAPAEDARSVKLGRKPKLTPRQRKRRSDAAGNHPRYDFEISRAWLDCQPP